MLKAALVREYTPAAECAARSPTSRGESAWLRLRRASIHRAARRARAAGHAREAVAQERGVDERAVLAEDVCGLAAMFVEHPAVVLQPHPATEDQLAQTIARFLRRTAPTSNPRPSSGALIPRAGRDRIS